MFQLKYEGNQRFFLKMPNQHKRDSSDYEILLNISTNFINLFLALEKDFFHVGKRLSFWY